MIRLLFRAVLALGATVSFAQAPYLVKDINPLTDAKALGSSPQFHRAHGGAVFFTATTPANGVELWKHAGGTTELVKDIHPGTTGSRPSGLSTTGSWLLFGADDGVHGLELWRSDGTAAGTALVKDIWPGPTGNVRVTQALGSQAVVLVSGASTRSDELWITDGTAEGTTLLVDLNTEPARTTMRSMTVRNNTLFLFTNRGIWTSDGTAAGTVKITSVTGSLVGATSTLILFAATDATHGSELWRTDGTAAGTTLVKDVNPGTASAFDFATGVSGATLASSTLFFANDGTGMNLWRSDGTAAGTQRVKSMYPPSGPGAQRPVPSGRGNLAWFHSAEGLWRSDGTEAGTFLVSSVASARSFVEAFGAVYFFTGQYEPELWASDGTTGGTRRVTTLPSGYLPTGLVFLSGRLYFAAGDPTNGVEPWVSEDGTAEGTHLLANVAPDPPPAGAPSSPSLLRSNGSNVFFTASESAGNPPSVWRSDGTGAGTVKLRDVPQYVSEMVVANGLSFFRIGSSLWRTDGTEAGTFQVSTGVQQILFGGRSYLYFFESWGLWRTDGTVAGTIRIQGQNYAAAQFTELAGLTYYVFEPNVWVTDGTPQGTYRALPQRFDVAAPTRMAAGHGRLWLEMNSTSTGSELWSSDGTYDGTAQIKDIKPGPGSSSPGPFTAAGNFMFFAADDGVNGRELWRSDGTPAGTVLVRDVAAGSASSNPDGLTAVGALLFFVADGGLWRTDGTSDGTIRLSAVDPISASAGLVAANGKLWFVRNDSGYGKELWRSDGTVEGTVLVADLEPGPTGSEPGALAAGAGRVFFSAQTHVTGRELFAVEPEGSDVAISDIRVAEGNSGAAIARFVVTRRGNVQTPLEVSFATADGSATAGADYVARSGVLAFAAGETTKTIDVFVNGEGEIEAEETFFVVLSVAATERARATAIISADDRRAELSIVPVDAQGSVRIVNAGPSTATNVRVRYSASPGYSGGSCWNNEMPCTFAAGLLAAGESVEFQLEPGSVDIGNRHDPLQPPALRVATSVTAMELDSNPADNFVEASAVGGLLLPPFLVAGSNAAATYFTFNSASVTISSDGAITVTPSSFSAAYDSATPVTLSAASTPGFSVLSVAAGSWAPEKGRIQIVAPGGTAKRDVRIRVETYLHYAETVPIPVQIAGTLHDGTRPGGTAELLDGATVLATTGLDATGAGTFSLSGVTTGSHDWHVRYAGDANFHGLTVAASIDIRPVSTTTTMTSTQTGCVLEGVVTVTASGRQPAGEVAMRLDSIEVARLTLQPAEGGKATAAYRVTLPPGRHSLEALFIPAEPFATSAAMVWPTAPDCAPVLAATASAAGVSLGWTAYNGGGNVVYEVFRSSTGVSFIGLGSTQATSFVDAAAARNSVWYYFVRARGANGVIVDSNHDFATNVFFTDDPLAAGVTAVRAAHIMELRAAVNAMRTAAGLAPVSGSATAAGQAIRAIDLVELGDALAPALAALDLPPVAPATVPAAQAMIRAAFVQALRNAMK